MDISSPITRRSVLTAGAGGIGVAALAACSSSGSKTASSDTAAAPGSSQDSSAGSAPASGSAAPGGSLGDDSGGDDSSSKDVLISLDDIKVGEGASVKLPNGKPAIVTRLTSTTAVCHSAVCTHQGCTVKPNGAELDCPCHGSKFNIKTGAVLNGPASEPLPKIAVSVQGGKVVES